MSNNNICNVYQTNPLLKGVRTKADLDAISLYCNNAMNFNYGPNPTRDVVQQPVCNCPFGYGYNATAYDFQSGPNFINLNQAQNYQKQQQMKSSFRGVPSGNSRYA
jgi:hypothetical protein